ncbi:MAG: GTP 3',8-cyclase MoaA [Planctomycetes bacterium]|nr:GTP 3',8-cyclase MoaA [Planctomycetota bacterium]
MDAPVLRDFYGRRIRNLRISITDRCNFRCIYCMPKDPQWMPREDLLTFEEIERVARIAVSIGIEKIRVTGGEPTARRDVPVLIDMLSRLRGLHDLSMTTNGLLLKELARPLWKAGLRRLNVSLDTLREEKFVHIARRDAFRKVWSGLEEAQQVGFAPIKVNMVVMRAYNEEEVVEFAKLARTRPWHIRFIEFMPLDGEGLWSREKVVPAQEILDRIREAGLALRQVSQGRLTDPARIFAFEDGVGEIGIIASVSEPFCFVCDRVRLTADGNFRTCLFSHTETPIRGLLRGGADDATIARVLVEAIRKKEAGHGINDPEFVKPKRAMYSIGG